MGYNPRGSKESDMTESGLAPASSPHAHFTWQEIETHTLILFESNFF